MKREKEKRYKNTATQVVIGGPIETKIRKEKGEKGVIGENWGWERHEIPRRETELKGAEISITGLLGEPKDKVREGLSTDRER